MAQDFVDIYNPANYKRCTKKLYTIHFCIPQAPTVVVNKLEQPESVKMLRGKTFITHDMMEKHPQVVPIIKQLLAAGQAYLVKDNYTAVLAGTRGEFWTTSLEKVAQKYNFLENGSLGFKIDPQKVLQDMKDGIYPWRAITTVPENSIAWACFVPKKQQGQVQTPWAVLNYNAGGVSHGLGDFIIAADAGGSPNLGDIYVVNGEVFADTYDNRGFTNVLKSDSGKSITIENLPNLGSSSGKVNLALRKKVLERFGAYGETDSPLNSINHDLRDDFFTSAILLAPDANFSWRNSFGYTDIPTSDNSMTIYLNICTILRLYQAYKEKMGATLPYPFCTNNGTTGWLELNKHSRHRLDGMYSPWWKYGILYLGNGKIAIRRLITDDVEKYKQKKDLSTYKLRYDIDIPIPTEDKEMSISDFEHSAYIRTAEKIINIIMELAKNQNRLEEDSNRLSEIYDIFLSVQSIFRLSCKLQTDLTPEILVERGSFRVRFTEIHGYSEYDGEKETSQLRQAVIFFKTDGKTLSYHGQDNNNVLDSSISLEKWGLNLQEHTFSADTVNSAKNMVCSKVYLDICKFLRITPYAYLVSEQHLRDRILTGVEQNIKIPVKLLSYSQDRTQTSNLVNTSITIQYGNKTSVVKIGLKLNKDSIKDVIAGKHMEIRNLKALIDISIQFGNFKATVVDQHDPSMASVDIEYALCGYIQMISAPSQEVMDNLLTNNGIQNIGHDGKNFTNKGYFLSGSHLMYGYYTPPEDSQMITGIPSSYSYLAVPANDHTKVQFGAGGYAHTTSLDEYKNTADKVAYANSGFASCIDSYCKVH